MLGISKRLYVQKQRTAGPGFGNTGYIVMQQPSMLLLVGWFRPPQIQGFSGSCLQFVDTAACWLTGVERSGRLSVTVPLLCISRVVRIADSKCNSVGCGILLQGIGVEAPCLTLLLGRSDTAKRFGGLAGCKQVRGNMGD